MNGSADSGILIPSRPASTVLLVAGDSKQRSEWFALLRAMGYTVVPDEDTTRGGAGGIAVPIDLIVLLAPADVALAVKLIREMPQGENAPPLVVFGAASGAKWPKRALQAGAFAYLHLDAPAEEQAGLLAAASRFRQMQVKIQLLLEESERMCSDLVGSFGQNSEKLHQTIEEARKAQQALQGMQAKIVKAFT